MNLNELDSNSLLVIRSRDRNINNNPDPNRVSIGPEISYFSNRSVDGLALHSFDMWFDIPNVNERNNVMVIDDGATSYPITVPTGRYDFNNLGGIINVQLNNLGIGLFSFAWNDTAQKYEFSNVPFPFTITKYPNQQRDLAELVGMPYNTVISAPFLGGSPAIYYTRNIYIASNNLHRYKKQDDQSSNPRFSNLLGVINVYPSVGIDYFAPDFGKQLIYPRMIHYEPPIIKKVNFSPEAVVGTTDISLYDDVGDLLYNPHEGKPSWEWTLNLILSKARDVNTR